MRSQPQAKNTPSNNSPESTGGLQRRHQQRVSATPTATVAQAPAASLNLVRVPLRTLSTPVIQTKLTVGSPNDKYEQEADRVAEQVMRMPTPAQAVGEVRSQLPRIQRKCAKCNDEQRLQMKETPGGTPEVTPVIATQIQSLEGGGQPLPITARNFFEPRFGQDFSHVRVHTNAQSARALGARAYTSGRNIVFDSGHYSPETIRGKKLLAHELTHTVQQREGPSNRVQRSLYPLSESSLYPFSESIEQPLDLSYIPTFGDDPVSRVIISCPDLRIALVTPSGTHIYPLDPDCQVPLGTFDAQVQVDESGRRVTWILGEEEGEGFREQARFRYRIRSGQENPATLLRNQSRVRVDSVRAISIPQDSRGQECFLSFPEKDIIDFNSFSEPLFPAQVFEDVELWSHTIPLGHLGWLDASAYASGHASGRLYGSYGPGTLHSACLFQRRGRNKLGGRARFQFPANIGANIHLDGTAGLRGEWLSFINIAHAAVTIDANGQVSGNAILDNNLVVVYDQNTRNWEFEGDSALTVQGGLGFTMNLLLSVSVVGLEVWKQRWNLADSQIGATWRGGLLITSQRGIEFRPGNLEIDSSSDASTSASISTSSGTGNLPDGSSGGSFTEELIDQLVGAVLNEAHANVEQQSGGQGQGGICLPPAFLTPGSPPGSVDDELRRLALQKRVAATDLSLNSFRRNYAVFKATVNGQTVYPYPEAFNDEGQLHSESLVVRQLESMDPGPPPLRNTRIIQVYTERQPCRNCSLDIEGLRRYINDFPVFHTISRRVRGENRPRRLMQAYCLTPPSNSSAGQAGSEEETEP